MTPPGRWLAFLAAQRQRLVAEAARVTGDAASAEDVVQEAWLRLAHRPPDGRSTTPGGYVRQVVRNLALDEYRQRRRREQVTTLDPAGDVHEVPSSEADAEHAMIASQELALVRAALAAMPPRMRRAVELHRLSGARLRTIADELDVSVTTAHALVTDGVERCRKALQQGRPDE